MSGDVRRALELCRKAAEIAEEQQHASAAPASSPGRSLVLCQDVQPGLDALKPQRAGSRQYSPPRRII